MEITQQRGAIPLQLDRPRLIFFDNKATWELYQKYGPEFASVLYGVGRGGPGTFELKSIDALAEFLAIGLQADAKTQRAPITAEQVAEFIRPFSLNAFFSAVVLALVGATTTPAPGKTPATGSAAKPAAKKLAAPGSTKVSTMTTRNASSTRSGGRRKSSGQRRSAK